MATSGSFNTTSREGRYLTFSWSVKSQDTANNKTTISWTLKGGGDSGYVYCGDFEVTIDGTKVYSNGTRREVYNTTTIASGTRTITHSADGTKTLTASVKASIYTYTQDRTGSGSWALPTIARTPTVTVSNTAKTETSATMKWSSNLTINRVRYRTSTNSGSSWSSWTSKTVSAKSGSYTISGLTANTSYTIQTELRSSESSLTNTANKTVKTYAWPYATISDFNIIDGMKVTIVNPLEHTATLRIYAQDTLIETWEGAYTYDFDTEFESVLLALIKDRMTGSWYCTVEYGDHTTTSATKTFSAAGYNPTVNVVRYADTNAAAQAIIQDNQKILQNISDPLITATGSGLFGATLASGSIEILGVTKQMVKTSDTTVAGVGGTINSATDVTAKVTVTDSRGNSSSQTITITMAEYTLPSAIISLARRNNYYSDTDITVDANVMDFPGNTPTITAQWKEEGAASWEDSATLQDNVLATLNLNNEKAWTVQVTVTDSFGGSTSYNLYVGIGLPILYIDRMLRAVGINCFPEAGEPFAVEGVDILGELFYKPGDKLSIDGTGTGGAPFTGYVTASTTTIRFMVPTGKSLANITTITCNICVGGIRGISGYVDGSRDNTDWTSGYTITCTKATDKIVQVEVKKSSAFSGVTNNTPIAYAAANFELEFN